MKILKGIKSEHIVAIDIETTRLKEHYEDLSDRLQYRMNSLRKEYSALIEYCQEGLTVDMYNLEQRFLEEFRKYKYIPKKHFTGHTECLTVNPINFYYYYNNN